MDFLQLFYMQQNFDALHYDEWKASETRLVHQQRREFGRRAEGASDHVSEIPFSLFGKEIDDTH
ncbi:hypothetical protein OH491_15940 [Termitidicoccus mucosus]|uniref:hypothetical protein n=1 Tax=Termitidicoccus mucosus TaxID=1184151 RepID=UPI0011AB61E0